MCFSNKKNISYIYSLSVQLQFWFETRCLHGYEQLCKWIMQENITSFILEHWWRVKHQKKIEEFSLVNYFVFVVEELWCSIQRSNKGVISEVHGILESIKIIYDLSWFVLRLKIFLILISHFGVVTFWIVFKVVKIIIVINLISLYSLNIIFYKKNQWDFENLCKQNLLC